MLYLNCQTRPFSERDDYFKKKKRKYLLGLSVPIDAPIFQVNLCLFSDRSELSGNENLRVIVKSIQLNLKLVFH